MDSKITFTLHADGKSTEKTIVYNQLLAIGYAGRNIAKTMEHIKELEEQLGVPAPKKIPTIFQMSNMLLTQDPDIDFVGNNTCGEVEYIIIAQGDEIYIGLGSDHTDRKLENGHFQRAELDTFGHLTLAAKLRVGIDLHGHSAVGQLLDLLLEEVCGDGKIGRAHV